MIRQELNPVTCKLDGKQINLRRYNPDRHCENGSMSWRDGKNHQKDVTTSYATASRCVTTVPLYGETDRITNWCDHQLCNRCITTVPFRGETDRITTCRYKILRPVSHPPNVHSFVGTARTNGAVPPALVLWLERERTEGREREKFYIYSDVTHTHKPRRAIE